MGKYLDWVKAAWNHLEHDFSTGAFVPNNESDIKSHLYHCLLVKRPESLQNRILTTEYSVGSQKVDLAILTKTGRLRVLIEIKETSSEGLSIREVQRRIEDDIQKMRHAKADADTHARKPVMIFYFRGANPQRGIGVRLHQKIEHLATQYSDIVLLWGPI